MTKLVTRPPMRPKKEPATVSKLSAQLATIPYLPSDPSLRQAKIKSEVRKGNVEHVMPMIAQKARATLGNLPRYVQVWFDLDDLIAEGVGAATTVVLKKHSNKGSAGYVTYLWESLDNLYKDKLKAAYAEKRLVRGIYSLEDPGARGDSTGKLYSLKDVLDKRIDKFSLNEERLNTRIDSERAFLKLYSKSSPQLRRYLIQWILQPAPAKMKKNASLTKVKKYGKKFVAAEQELKELSPAALLGIEHCKCIWRDSECRRNICKKLCRMFRTNSKETDTRPNPPLKESLEGMVARVALAKW